MSLGVVNSSLFTNMVDGYTTTATAAGTTTLSYPSSTRQQFFTGTTTQTLRLPVTTTFPANGLGIMYEVVNNSTGIVTVQTGGSVTITTVSPSTSATFRCVNVSTDATTSWSFTAPAASVGSLSGDVIGTIGATNVVAVDALPINATTGANSSIFFGYSSTVPAATQSIGIGYQALNVVSGTQNTALGVGAGLSLTTGTGNTLLGYNVNTGADVVNAIVVGNGSKAGVASATDTIMIGSSAGNLTATGDANIGIGTRTFQAATSINRSIAIGFDALSSATGGNGAIAIGWQALKAQNGGSGDNIGIGINAGFNLTSGSKNTIIGYVAGQAMTTGSGNTILGYFAGQGMTAASTDNVLIGAEVGLLLGNPTSSIAIGTRALARGSGSDNICVGSFGLSTVTTGSRNIAIGSGSALGLTTGTGNIAIGYAAFGNNSSFGIGTSGRYNITGSNNIAIGNECSSFDPATSNIVINLFGSNNIALGANASRYVTFNAASNIAIGTNAYSTGGGSSDSVTVGNNALVGAVGIPLAGSISQSGTTVTTGAAFFLPEMVGGTIVYPVPLSSGVTGISAFVSSTVVTATTSLTVTGTNAFVFYNLSGNTAVGTNALNAARTGRSTAVGGNALNVATAGRYAVGTASQATTTITGVGTAWFAEMVGGTIVFAGGATSLITGFTDATTLTAATSQTVGSTTYIIYLPYNGNVGVGYSVGSGVTTGHYNTLMGYSAGSSITTGFNNVCVGFEATSSVSDAVAIGRGITANQDGGFFCTHRGPLSVTFNAAGFIAGTNELVELTSSRRFKTNIRDLEDVSDKFAKLRPVRFNPLEGHGDVNTEHIGLIAEEVEALWPEFVAHDLEGQTTGMAYDRMISVLIKEMQNMKEDNRRENAELRAQISELKGIISEILASQ